jgi:predicted transcriptional regulator
VLGRFSASGLRVARYSGICPLWNVHRARLQADTPRRQIARMPDGTDYFSIAALISEFGAEPGGPSLTVALELGCEIGFAKDLVYADGLDLDVPSRIVPIGTTCRLCERIDCNHRVMPPVRVERKVDRR